MAAENEGVEGAAEAFNGGEPRDQNAPGVMIKEFEGAINKEEAAAVQEKLREVQEAAAEAVATVEEPAPEPAAPAEEPAPETPAEAAREEKVAEAEVKKITEITDVDELQQEIQKREQELNSIKTKEGQVDLPEIIEQYSKIAGPIKKFIGKAKEFKKTVLKVTRTEVTLDDRIKKFKDMLTSSSNPRELEDVIKEINKRKNMSTDEKRYCVLEIELTYLRNRLALSKAEKEAVKEKNELDAKLEDIGKRINDIENFYKGKKPLNVKKLKKFAEKFVKRAEKGKELAEINRDIEKIGTIKYKATNVALCLGIPSEIYPTIKEYCKLKAEFASLNIGT